MEGSNNFILGPDYDYTYGNPCIFKTSQHMIGGYLEYVQETDPETGAVKGRYNRYQYGVQFTNYGYTSKSMHTYRLENRINSDGSNMVWLSIDGEELGPMDNYYFHANSVTNDMGVKSDWFNGMDIDINYLLSRQYRDKPSQFTFDYIQVWENGDQLGDYSYYHPEWSTGSCAEGGQVKYTCDMCGASYMESSAACHFYETPIFVWDNQYNCEAQFSCVVCDNTHTISCDVSKEKSGEFLLYTAVTEYEGETYWCKKTVQMPLWVPGDINGDSNVNNRDAARLMQYLAGWDVEYVEAALDVTGDGNVNNRDAARLMQYLAGWDVVIN